MAWYRSLVITQIFARNQPANAGDRIESRVEAKPQPWWHTQWVVIGGEDSYMMIDLLL
jgi:hypothetical protein